MLMSDILVLERRVRAERSIPARLLGDDHMVESLAVALADLNEVEAAWYLRGAKDRVDGCPHFGDCSGYRGSYTAGFNAVEGV